MRTAQIIIAFAATILTACEDVNVTNDENSPVPVTIQNDAESLTEFRWVGFTTTVTDGDIDTVSPEGPLSGHSAMNRLCAVEVASNARACTSAETAHSVMHAPSVLPNQISGGWLIPVGITLIYDPVGLPTDSPPIPGWLAYENFSGQGPIIANPQMQHARREIGCDGFNAVANSSSGKGYSGIAVRFIGDPHFILALNCTAEIPIACCAPVEIPVTP